MASNKQPTGYNFDVKGKLVKEHECPICLMLIRNATELPCSHLMCRECLVYYEEKELQRNKHGNFLCSLCQETYQRNEKKEVRSVDRIIRESLEVKCKNWKDGCDWVGCITDYQNHHTNICEFVTVECPNNGCNKQMQRREVERHKKDCVHRIIPCRNCNGEFPAGSLEDHYKTCPSCIVCCQNLGCKEMVQRKQMDEHCKNECQYQIISCCYSEVGCTVQLFRLAMSIHQQEAMQHHSFLLLKSHVELTKKNQDLKEKLKKSDETIEKLQETVTIQEESIKTQQAEINVLKNDIKRMKASEVKQKLNNLEKFANQAVALLDTISRIDHAEVLNSETLHQKKYNKNYLIKMFEAQLREKDIEKADCCYLNSLGGVINKYYEIYCPTTYQERLRKLAWQLQRHIATGFYGIWHIKTDSYPCRKIIFSAYNDEVTFGAMIERNHHWKRNSRRLATYYDFSDSCYYVAMFLSEEIKEAWLLHSTNEHKRKMLTINGVTSIKWDVYLCRAFFVFELNTS